MYYTFKQVARIAERAHPGMTLGCLANDWLEQYGELLQIKDAVCRVIDTLGIGGDEEIELVTLALNDLRIAAGLPADPIDEADGDRADEAYEREVDGHG
jgi:hypothetical protein